MTIIESILANLSIGICSSASWDILKQTGGKLINSFKNKFLNDKSFDSEQECYEFLEIIFNNTPNSKKDPYKDVQFIYEEITENSNFTFIDNFKQWVIENASEFENVNNLTSQQVSVKIDHQENNGAGTIINAGIINNY
ncbi:hypothetical protein ACIOBL_10270 [Paenibacillus taichungensis]|uniref:hypothetical protein n=1 Tax=Paenibacillus taichungensis TaxID=484184 RepID=UPI00381F9009